MRTSLGAAQLLTLWWAAGAARAAAACEGDVTYVATSRRNASGHRELAADLRVSEATAGRGPVRLEVQQGVCADGGVRRLRIETFISTPEIIRTPPPGYELAAGLGWYRLHLAPLTWEDARLSCEAEGAHLAVLNSPREAAVLKGMFVRAPNVIPKATYNHVAHIGFTDIEEGKYVTIFGESLAQAGFNEWGGSQPNNGTGPADADSDCGGVERSGKLNDVPCRSLIAYFCEFEL